MNIKNSRKPRLGLYLRVVKDGEVSTHRRRSLKAFFNLLRGCIGEEYTIRITYYNGVVNEGTYNTKKDLMFAARAFTNSKELEFVKEYWKGNK